MKEDEISFDWRKYPTTVISILFIAAILVSWSLGSNSLREESELLKTYQNAFTKCKDTCHLQKLVGYIRQINELHHKCFCYNYTDNSIRETPSIVFGDS